MEAVRRVVDRAVAGMSDVLAFVTGGGGAGKLDARLLSIGHHTSPGGSISRLMCSSFSTNVQRPSVVPIGCRLGQGSPASMAQSLRGGRQTSPGPPRCSAARWPLLG